MNYKLFVIATLLVLVSACSSRNRSANNDLPPEATEQVEVDGDIQPENALAGESLPNPIVAALVSGENKYLANKQSISSKQRTLLESAVIQLAESNYDSALQSVEQAQVLGPLNSASLVLSADIYQKLERPEDVMSSLQQALVVNPHNPKALNRLAKIKRQQGLFSDALVLYNRAVESVPADLINYRNRGALLDLYLDDKVLAMQDYQTYLLLLEEQERVASINLEDKAVNKKLTREIRLVKVWLNDLQRQIDTKQAKQE